MVNRYNDIDNEHNTGQLPLMASQADVPSFDNFAALPDALNLELLDVLKQFSSQGTPTPFYLYGNSGAGKTHLLSATMRSVQQSTRDTARSSVLYFDLSNPVIQATFLTQIEQADFIFLDNIDAWAGDAEKERALFAVVERAKQQQWALLAAAQDKASQAGFALADLVSRLDSGVVYHVKQLSDDGKFAAIQARAKYRGLMIQDDAIRYLLTHHARDNKSLFASIDQLDKASLVAKRKVTVPFLQQVLSQT